MDPCQAGRSQEARSPEEPRQEAPSLVVQCRAEHYLVERCLEALYLAEPCPAGPFLVEPSQAERCLEISTGGATGSGLAIHYFAARGVDFFVPLLYSFSKRQRTWHSWFF